MADLYNFSRFHDQPERDPRVKIGLVMGYLDGYTGVAGWCL